MTEIPEALTNLLQTTISDLPDSNPLPPATYVVQVGRYEFGTSNAGKPFVSFEMNVLSPADGFNVEADLPRKIRHRVYLTPEAAPIAKRFFVGLGVPEHLSLEQAIQLSQGRQALAEIRQSTMRDGDQVYNTISRVVPLS